MMIKAVIVPKNQPLIQKKLYMKGVAFIIADLVEIDGRYWWEMSERLGYYGFHSYERTRLWAAYNGRKFQCPVLYRSNFKLIEEIMGQNEDYSHKIFKLYFPFYRWDLK